MGSVTSDSNQSSPQIDYLSSLPNELLDDIFEYAYIEFPPSKPLSKRLLHWFEKHFYRKVSLSSSRQFSKFTALSSVKFSIGQHVRSLKFENKDAFEVGLRQLLNHLPNLVKLDIPYLPALFPSGVQIRPPAPYLLRLECLTTSFPGSPDLEVLDLDCLAQLATLPALKQLEVYDWHENHPSSVRRSPTTLIPSIETLKIQGDAADYSTPLTLINACPSLLKLELNSSFEDGQLEFRKYLPSLPFNLRSLSIHGSTYTHPPVDPVLTSFTLLRSVRLGDGAYSTNIHVALQQLPLLVRVHLGKGEIDPDAFISLVSGPTRLPSLDTLILDFDEGVVGGRIGRPSKAGFSRESEMEGCDVNMGDWSLPGEWDGQGLYPVGIKRLIQVAKENEVVVEGSVFCALENVVAYRIEANHRAVLFTYVHHALYPLREARVDAALDGIALPPLDLASLDINRLEIVEIDLPEQDWFMLSLRNKE